MKQKYGERYKQLQTGSQEQKEGKAECLRKRASLKRKKKAYLTTETTYHPVIKLYRCKYTYSSITQQIFLHHQLGAKNPLGHKIVDTDSNSVQKGRIMSLIVYLQRQKTIEYNNVDQRLGTFKGKPQLSRNCTFQNVFPTTLGPNETLVQPSYIDQ